MDKIIILALPGLGDSLMSTPMIKILRRSFKDYKIDVLVMQKSTYEIFKTNPNIDRVYYFDFVNSGFFKSLKFLVKYLKNNYNISITIYPSYPKHYHIISYLIGAKVRIAHKFHRGYFREFHFLNTNLVDANENEHNVINNINLLKPLDININKEKAKKLNLEVYLTDKDESVGKEFFNKYNIDPKDCIFLHNGSSKLKKNSEKRRLPKYKLKELVNILISQGYNIIVNIGPEEKDIKKFLFKKYKNFIFRNIFPLEGFNIREVAAVIKRCNKIITTDSSIMHISAALKKDIICLLGPTDAKKIHPWNTKYSILKSNLECSPCYTSYTFKSFECKYKCYNESFPCMDYIDIKKILEIL